MHIGRRYRITDFLVWTGREAGFLVLWSLLVTFLIEVTSWNFLTIPVPILTIIGSALAIVLAFKNQQCYARFGEALATSGQLTSSSLVFANRLVTTLSSLDATVSGPLEREIFYRHFAWLTALRFALRERRAWENAFEAGNVRHLAGLPTPESRSGLKEELKTYLPDIDLKKVIAHQGDKDTFILNRQYQAITDLHREKLISELSLVTLTPAIDDFYRLQGALKRIKNYPYARNYYSIAVFLVIIYVGLVPFGLYPYAQDLGKSSGAEHLTVWLNVPFSAIVGWLFVSLEKVGENSSNPFEGGANDVPISSITRKIEIEMRMMLGEPTDLKPIEAKDNILF